MNNETKTATMSKNGRTATVKVSPCGNYYRVSFTLILDDLDHSRLLASKEFTFQYRRDAFENFSQWALDLESMIDNVPVDSMSRNEQVDHYCAQPGIQFFSRTTATTFEGMMVWGLPCNRATLFAHETHGVAPEETHLTRANAITLLKMGQPWKHHSA